MKSHFYSAQIKWTGNRGSGTDHYKNYDRSHLVSFKNKTDLQCSSDPAFRGDPAKYNPEELLLASLSSCHMLWYLHLCADAGVVVTEYIDEPKGVMMELESGKGKFTEVILYPRVVIINELMKQKALDLHQAAHRNCFIANSVNFEVKHIPTVEFSKKSAS